jgi:hypothetical protein
VTRQQDGELADEPTKRNGSKPCAGADQKRQGEQPALRRTQRGAEPGSPRLDRESAADVTSGTGQR